MKEFINLSKSKNYLQKGKNIQNLIQKALYILSCFGIPLDSTPRRLERMAIAFLACADVKDEKELILAKDLNTGFYLKTRDIIEYVNEYFEENISSGSYDDIRRKDLKLLVLGKVILQSSPNSATNDSSRGYGLNPLYAELLKKFGQEDWEEQVRESLKNIEPISKKLARTRDLKPIPVIIPGGMELKLTKGKHNLLQKAIVEEFLPRYGYGCEVLYLGDTSDKYLLLEKDKLETLKLPSISHDELPDIIAYSDSKDWIYLIEAVHSSGPISEIRFLQLKKMIEKCSAEIIFVTAFLDRATFRKFAKDIAWETEVWIASNPDHLIHFNGGKFLGPYK